jgi:small-conductance mechanosensitive channel
MSIQPLFQPPRPAPASSKEAEESLAHPVEESSGLDLPVEVLEPNFKTAVTTAVLATSAAIASSILDVDSDSGTRQFSAWACASLFVLIGMLCVRATGREVQRVLDGRVPGTHPSALRLLVNVIGAIVVITTALGLTAVSASNLIVSGAITGVVLGIAAQQALGNLFAGVVLLIARPFNVGDHIHLRSGALGGDYDGVISDVGFTYVSLATEEGIFRLPNAAVLAAGSAVVVEPAAGEETEEVPVID